VSAHFVTSRAVGNQLVRHRFFAFTQESTRYNNYKALEFIGPVSSHSYSALVKCANTYETSIANGVPPEEARDDLPLRLKTEIHMTLPTEGWVYILVRRLSKHAQKATRASLLPVGVALCKEFPELKNWLTLPALQRIYDVSGGDL
jgi:thymidylate synthase ThyX